MAVPVSLRSLRKVSHELRHVFPNKPVSQNETMRLLLTEARKHDVTDERTCRPASELTFMADVFACYLESSRIYRDLVDNKPGRETTVQEAARIVGLELPTKPSS